VGRGGNGGLRGRAEKEKCANTQQDDGGDGPASDEDELGAKANWLFASRNAMERFLRITRGGNLGGGRAALGALPLGFF